MTQNTIRVFMKSELLLITVILIFILPQRVSAYLDPGFGSMVWQMIAAVAFGAAFAVKIYWQKIKNFFRRSKTNKDKE
jgi:NADH:ubiquinone oxidoreductase subunit K